ncbi:MAG: homoserine dehydrogenase [Lachnospiraceae bacterium]|nr:homoserine dehydrogenase [Lachnospiraceae bacterium]
MKEIKIGLLGLGNIGTGTYKTLEMNRDIIEKNVGTKVNIVKILEKDVDRERDITVSKDQFVSDPEDIFQDPEIDIVIELLGGVEPAATLMERAMDAGKHVVTANKAAVAAHYPRLTEAAKRNGVMFKFEASVGGGIPVLTSLAGAARANRYTEVLGIVNGTTNYILHMMSEEGMDYEEALRDAQEKGFAEADPTADVEGIDAANKLSILMALMFDKYVHPDDIPTTGIKKITKEKIEEAKSNDCVIKLIAHATVREDGEITYEVRPTYIRTYHPLANVLQEFNAVYVKGNLVGKLMFYGPGAGPLPTGSAVMGDVMEISKAILAK